MTTTAEFQQKPDFYTSKEECAKAARQYIQTNPRYRDYNQTHFTAGDEEQFVEYRDASNGQVCMPDIDLKDNLFADTELADWPGYEGATANTALDTFRYIFNKFKKGIFVKIKEGRLKVFLPFSKNKFENEWAHKILIDPKYRSMNDFLGKIARVEGRDFNPRRVNGNIGNWYGNNCLVRSEWPINEGDTNVASMKNMLEELCEAREVPDMEFFVNRRDFPLLKKDLTEPYNHLWGDDAKPLVSHRYDKYLPIFSMSVTDKYADLLLPTADDWNRVQSAEGIYFPKGCKEMNDDFDTPWEDKKATAVFRGGSTGCGVTIETNPRLKLAALAQQAPKSPDGIPYIDAGITNWNVRPRKLQNEKYLQTIEVDKLPFGLVGRMSPEEQSKYKYIVNVDGHVSAFRLSLELAMGSVILLVDSPWRIWYRKNLIPYEHYVPVKEDMSDLFSQIKWCRDNDEKCEEIAKNARAFYEKYLQKEGMRDYMQVVLTKAKKQSGIYLYNYITPLNNLLRNEWASLTNDHPETDKTVRDITTIPQQGRSYGVLKGMLWIFNMITKQSQFESLATLRGDIAKNRLSSVREFYLAGMNFAVKSTDDPKKVKEHIHETYVGLNGINDIVQQIPNFAYVFGIYQSGATFNVVTEMIKGETLYDYLKSNQFQMGEFLMILIQLCVAIRFAQESCGFVHYDLTPWNIIIQRSQVELEFDYMVMGKVVRLKSRVIPIIIDYGKSHIISGGEHHGFINMFRMSTIQDPLTLLLTSINTLVTEQNLQGRQIGELITLANFITKTKYRNEPFRGIKDMKSFVGSARRYSTLISSEKYELENLNPMSLVNYIVTHFKYPFGIMDVKSYNSLMDKGNPRQVFDYVLSGTAQEKAHTYLDVFKRVKHCSIPQSKNTFLNSYAIQILEKSLLSVRENMMYFLYQAMIDAAPYEAVFVKTMRFLDKVFSERLRNSKTKDIRYTVSEKEKKRSLGFGEELFALPWQVEKIVSGEAVPDNLAKYQSIVLKMLKNDGRYRLDEKTKTHYEKNFRNLLTTDPVAMMSVPADANSIRTMSGQIYSENIPLVMESSSNQPETADCTKAMEYVDSYERTLLKLS